MPEAAECNARFALGGKLLTKPESASTRARERCRVVLVSLGQRGGGVLYGYYVARELAKKCALMAVISRHCCNRREWSALPLKSLVEVDAPRTATEALFRLLNVREFLQVRSLIARFGPDVLYVPMRSPLSPVLCGLVRGVPRVITEHDPVLHPGDRSFVKKVLQRIALLQATRIVVLSKEFVSVVAGRGFPAARVDVIPHGLFDCYNQRREQPRGTFHKPPVILFFGRFEPYKGLHILLEAFGTIRKTVPGVRLRVVGSGTLEPRNRRAFNMEGVEVVNRWIEEEEVGQYFANADLVVLPYTEASQSGVVTIAAAFGVPVVASNVGGLGAQVKHGHSGLVVPPGDSNALAEACIAVLSDGEFKTRLAAGALDLARYEMSWDRIGSMIYASCLNAIRDYRQGKAL